MGDLGTNSATKDSVSKGLHAKSRVKPLLPVVGQGALSTGQGIVIAMERHCLQIIRNESAHGGAASPGTGDWCRAVQIASVAKPRMVQQGQPMTDASDIGPAREAFLALQRKARKRKNDREHASRKRRAGKTIKARPSPPQVFTPRDWPAEQKAHWTNALCVWMSKGGSLASFCREYPQGPEPSQWFKWFREDAIIQEAYTQARENGADHLAEETVAIADSVRDAGQFDSARVNAARLAVDARKWVASKLKPKTYADRLETVTSGALTVTHTVSDEDRAKFLASMVARQTIAKAPNLVEAQRMIEAQVIDVTPEKTASKDGPGQ